jgi:hypothetical protein
MASTRDKNSPGNYSLEQYALKKERDYLPYKPFSCPQETMFCGDGLLMGRIGNTQLSENAINIENFLYGIGSSNLVNPQSPVVPEIKQLNSLSIIDRIPLILPKPLTTQPAQRLRLFE